MPLTVFIYVISILLITYEYNLYTYEYTIRQWRLGSKILAYSPLQGSNIQVVSIPTQL